MPVPSPKPSVLPELRDLLADLIPASNLDRIMFDSGVPKKKINTALEPINIWHAILTYCETHEIQSKLETVVCKEFPNHTHLASLCKLWIGLSRPASPATIFARIHSAVSARLEQLKSIKANILFPHKHKLSNHNAVRLGDVFVQPDLVPVESEEAQFKDSLKRCSQWRQFIGNQFLKKDAPPCLREFDEWMEEWEELEQGWRWHWEELAVRQKEHAAKLPPMHQRMHGQYLKCPGQQAALGWHVLAEKRRWELDCPSEGRAPASEWVVRERLLVVLGDPGLGKSTLLQWLALGHWPEHPVILPLFFRLADWKGVPLQKELADLAKLWLREESALDGMPLLWLLDGMDEIREPGQRDKFRDEVRTLAVSRPQDRIIVSSRPSGYVKGGMGVEWKETTLAPLSEEQAGELLANYKGILMSIGEEVGWTPQSFLAGFDKDPGLAPLRRNPFLLSLAVLYFLDHKTPPHGRLKYYETAAGKLPGEWQAQRDGLGEQPYEEYLPRFLQRLALTMMERNLTEIPRSEFDKIARKFLECEGLSPLEIMKEMVLVHKVAGNLAGILVERGMDKDQPLYGFLHLSFQEYFAAICLVKGDDEAFASRAKASAMDVNWSLVWEFVALASQNRPDRLDALHTAAGTDTEGLRKRLRWSGLGNEELATLDVPSGLCSAQARRSFRGKTPTGDKAGLAGEACHESSGMPEHYKQPRAWAMAETLKKFEGEGEGEGEAKFCQGLLGILKDWERKPPEVFLKSLLDILKGTKEFARGWAEQALWQWREHPEVKGALTRIYDEHFPPTSNPLNRCIAAAACRALGGSHPAPIVRKSGYLEIDLGSSSLILVKIPAGEFKMGSPKSEAGRSDNENQVKVTLSEFWMAETQFTQAQWLAVMGTDPSWCKGGNMPVEQVGWEDCQECIAKLNEMFKSQLPKGYKFSLPTEAQWEYACRAGRTTAFHYGEDLDSTMANFDGLNPGGKAEKGVYRERTTPVGSFPPNAWGLYDLHGNLWEWCQDWYGDSLTGGTDPTGATGGSYRVVRGGSWLNFGRFCRSATRFRITPDLRYDYLGFRPALSLARPSR